MKGKFKILFLALAIVSIFSVAAFASSAWSGTISCYPWTNIYISYQGKSVPHKGSVLFFNNDYASAATRFDYMNHDGVSGPTANATVTSQAVMYYISGGSQQIAYGATSTDSTNISQPYPKVAAEASSNATANTLSATSVIGYHTVTNAYGDRSGSTDASF